MCVGRLAQAVSFDALVAAASPVLAPQPTSSDAPALVVLVGQYRAAEGVVHPAAPHAGVCGRLARGVLGIHEGDRCFSVAELFFAYGLGNGIFFSLPLGATAICGPAR